ncbi:hypothetical protein SAMN02746041_00101 [Desulfacinum hydrothermale DSM 13146]|uniref:Uncharacterized protein n=1 Tax=Desulfacinum hydrothermale DSM 13146 TaxID=1121390 RepID=A0A1W1WXZ6_9BACT|nr:hypothetical protein [Desulfacinum hydrothermale]SMC16535.1 hypothetical protein SAMN02746041_00101 [Desulfacinum hydrothermale DSM 13146]
MEHIESSPPPRPSFPLHLCQPDPGKSCAACCGIYNFQDNSRRAVSERLLRNTLLLQDRNDLDHLHDHSTRYRPLDNGRAKRFKTIFNCEFVGFLDSDHRRVGCLLHPGANDARDLRHVSFYGRQLCDGHFCLSYYYLTEDEQRLVVESIQDWYLYGLIITDIDLVKGIYQALSDTIGEGLRPASLQMPPIRKAIQTLWAWKLDWPWRRPGPDSFGKYLFQGEDYREIRIPYRTLGRPVSAYDRILKSLGSSFRSAAELEAAEHQIQKGVESVARLYEALFNRETL